jgi:hypothetical protein
LYRFKPYGFEGQGPSGDQFPAFNLMPGETQKRLLAIMKDMTVFVSGKVPATGLLICRL